MGDTNTNPNDDKKAEIERIEEFQRTKREELAGKSAERKAERAEQQKNAEKWAQQQVREDEKKAKEAEKKKEQYKKQKKQSEKEYAEFRARKDAEEKRLKDQQKKREEERKQKLLYMKELSNKNRWNMLNEKKIRDAEETKEKMKKDAEIEAKREKLQLMAEEKRRIHRLENDFRKEFNQADIYEKDQTERIRTDARREQSKLVAQEQAETSQLDGKILRERARAESYPNPAQRQIELRKAEQMERNERKKLRDKYAKMATDIEKQANTQIIEAKKRAKSMRDDVTTDHKKAVQRVESERRDKYNRAEKDRIQHNKDAEQAEKDILSTQIPMPKVEEDKDVLDF